MPIDPQTRPVTEEPPPEPIEPMTREQLAELLARARAEAQDGVA